MNGSILIVDDDVDIGINTSDILEDMGYDTDVATDGASALQLIRSKTYDVALLDFRMPDMDGATLYGHIKALQPDVVAIMVTAFAADDGVSRARAAGTWQVLRKPVNIEKLLELIGCALQKPLVLLVDDDRDFCSTLWDILREQNYRVGLAHDAGDAKRRLQNRRYEVVLLDLKLSEDTDGRQVLGVLKETPAASNTILITGYRSEMRDVIEELLHTGVNSVYYKPLELDKVLLKLSELV